MKHRIRGAIALFVCAAFVGPGSAQESASYVMERIAFSAGARHASSASFDISVTFAQDGPVGSASFCNQGFVQNTGFWSLRGYSPVPVALRAARNDVNSSQVDLSWTGSASSFEVYSSTVPNGIVDPSNLAAVTPECAVTDSPPTSAIVYYVVVPADF